jgi:hypothetical protein
MYAAILHGGIVVIGNDPNPLKRAGYDLKKLEKRNIGR